MLPETGSYVYIQSYKHDGSLHRTWCRGFVLEANEDRIAAAQLAAAKELAAKVEAASVTVKIKGGENGKTYGSVSTKEIAEAVKEQLGLEIDKKKIVLPEPIKAFGTYEAAVKLHRDVQAKLSVKVTEA